ncbi:MAG TPA: hypothetical protein VNU03_02020 [Methylomirabilota bacterium]|nr:hypothetical protein [Methylomirabilota bacterium]
MTLPVEMARDKKPASRTLKKKLVFLGVLALVVWFACGALTDWYHGYLVNRCIRELGINYRSQSAPCEQFWRRGGLPWVGFSDLLSRPREAVR